MNIYEELELAKKAAEADMEISVNEEVNFQDDDFGDNF